MVVGINSDEWLIRKKGFRFMPWKTRAAIIENLKGVEHVFRFNDSDGSAKDAIRKMIMRYPFRNFIFANGGDRTQENIPEMDLQKEYFGQRLKFVFGVGGNDKKNSSTNILTEYEEYVKFKNNIPLSGVKLGDLNKSSLPSDSKAGGAAEKISVEYFLNSEEYSESDYDGEEREEILYSSKSIYSDIYDYTSWRSPVFKKDR